MPKHIIVDSSERIAASASSSDFWIRLPVAISGTRFELVSARIPNVIYNVDATNNTIRWSDGAVRSATIPEGFYTPGLLKAAIEAAMQAVSPLVYTVSQGADLKFSIGASAAITLLFANTSLSIAPVLGFNSVDTAAAVLHTAARIVLLMPPRLYIQLPDLTDGVQASGVSASFVVPLNANRGEMITYDSATNFSQVLYMPNETPLRQIRVRLLGQDGATVDLHRCDWQMILSVS